MHSMTLEQFRVTVRVGGVTGVTLKGQGNGFFVEIATRSGDGAFLAKARSSEPRRFGNPASALLVLRAAGVAIARIDATHWSPGQQDLTTGKRQGSAGARNQRIAPLRPAGLAPPDAAPGPA